MSQPPPPPPPELRKGKRKPLSDDDERYTYMDAEDYWLACTMEGIHSLQPLLGILDRDDGYIAFTTSDAAAVKIVHALRDANDK